MIADAKEHICSGCYEVIASHDPEAYQQGTFYYHSKAPRIGPSPAIGMLFSRRKGSIRGKYFENLRDANDGPQGGLVQLLAANFRDRHVPHFWSVRRKLRQPYSGKARAKSFASSLA